MWNGMDASLDAVLPSGVVRQEGVAPEAPTDFGDDYTLPEHSTKPLQLLNTHPLDARLLFYEKPHIYTMDGVPTSTSVTGLAHQFEKPFVPDTAISLMKMSRTQAWPRYEYVNKAIPLEETEWTMEKGALKVSHGKTIAVVQPHSMGPNSTVGQMLEMLCATAVSSNIETDDVEVYVFDRAKNDVEIAEGWKRNGMIASHRGTEAHYLAECFFNGVAFRHTDPDMDVLFDFCHKYLIPLGMTAYNTEKEIVCMDADVAGSIDLIVYDPTRKLYHIIDFKRSDKLKSQLRGYGKMDDPFKHLDDCKGAGYALQTSIYQYILEREYGLPIGDRILLSLHADKPFVTSVPYLKAETEYIMNQRMALVRARHCVMEELGLKCSLTGAPLVDAVRLTNGTLAMEKAALVRDLLYTVAYAERIRFTNEVDRRVGNVTLDPEPCKSWRRLMPETGLVPFQC